MPNLVSLNHFLSCMTKYVFESKSWNLQINFNNFLNCEFSLYLVETLRDFHLTNWQMNKCHPSLCLYLGNYFCSLGFSYVPCKSQTFNPKLLYASCTCFYNYIIKLNIIYINVNGNGKSVLFLWKLSGIFWKS